LGTTTFVPQFQNPEVSRPAPSYFSARRLVFCPPQSGLGDGPDELLTVEVLNTAPVAGSDVCVVTVPETIPLSTVLEAVVTL
jgi:hypothetical protein